MQTRDPRENRAIKAVLEKRVKKVKVKTGSGETYFFIVEGSQKEKFYLVIPGLYCSCPDFLFSVRFRKRKEKCYHMMAVDIALREGKYEEIEMDKDTFLSRIVNTLLGKAPGGSKGRRK
jgi:predicted nucleic acid-binding Zn finger protein